jgi:sulfane dehydrogenase subunit SoxC
MTNDKLETAEESVAGNGLLSRRLLLGLGISSTAAALSPSLLAAEASRFNIPSWSKQPGPGPSAYGQPSPFVAGIQRDPGRANPLYPGGGASRTPLHALRGTLTPNGLHFERHHAGVPAIDPAEHKLIINGLVDRALAFSYDDLLRYPMVSRIQFLECSGNSGALFGDTPPQGTAQSINGLVSCAEWTGIPLSVLLNEAGIDPTARWLSCVGADAASMGRSIPLDKALDDVLVALFQNGEPLRPEQGFPLRLFVPGWEGNVSVKWLTQLKLAREPSQFRDETSKYTDTLADRKSLQFSFPMGVKSIITSPSGKMQLQPGLYQIEGLAWSGAGRITKVEVSADGGASWAPAHIDAQSGDKSLARFRVPWRYSGAPAQLISRATDSEGKLQPTRDALLAEVGSLAFYHFNAQQCWAVDNKGEVSNAYV